jgi:DNA ligase-associated metallophosphoesterase
MKYSDEKETCMQGTASKQLLGQNLILLPDRALMWREKRLLVVADPHFGKAQVFRDQGIPVPAGATAGDLARLSGLVETCRPRGLLFLGDLVHGPTVNAHRLNEQIRQWRRRHRGLRLYLAVGNHDRWTGEPPAGCRFDVVAEEIEMGPFLFSHKPTAAAPGYRFSGHLHPAVTLTGKGRQKENLPCFSFGPRLALLPPFGSFTGHQPIRPSRRDHIYVITGSEVIEIDPK